LLDKVTYRMSLKISLTKSQTNFLSLFKINSMSEAINQGHVTFEIDSLGIGTITFGHPLSNS